MQYWKDDASETEQTDDQDGLAGRLVDAVAYVWLSYAYLSLLAQWWDG